MNNANFPFFLYKYILLVVINLYLNSYCILRDFMLQIIFYKVVT